MDIHFYCCGSQAPRWSPMIPYLLAVMALYSPLPCCIRICLCDHQNTADIMLYHFWGYLIEDIVASALYFLYPSLWGSQLLVMRMLGQPYKRSMWHGTEAFYQKPVRNWLRSSANPHVSEPSWKDVSALVNPSDDCSTSWLLDCNLTRDPEPEAPTWATLRFLIPETMWDNKCLLF